MTKCLIYYDDVHIKFDFTFDTTTASRQEKLALSK